MMEAHPKCLITTVQWDAQMEKAFHFLSVEGIFRMVLRIRREESRIKQKEQNAAKTQMIKMTIPSRHFLAYTSLRSGVRS